MPNLRIVYRRKLSHRGELECSAHSTPLMEWDAINATPIRFESLFSNKYADALETTDRPLVMRLRANCPAKENDLARLSGREGHELFKELVATQRAFWAKGSHLRLKWDDAPMPVRLDWAIGPGDFCPVLIPADRSKL
ncbi:MAG: hypothetical protein GVY36_11380 [Verrucomicrobia bacterium]|jgi:hypothetical protein|nr:hypothetical protein [Verrucomicrobiota bacterium]